MQCRRGSNVRSVWENVPVCPEMEQQVLLNRLVSFINTSVVSATGSAHDVIPCWGGGGQAMGLLADVSPQKERAAARSSYGSYAYQALPCRGIEKSRQARHRNRRLRFEAEHVLRRVRRLRSNVLLVDTRACSLPEAQQAYWP